MLLSLLRLVVFSMKFGMLVRCGLLLHGLHVFWLLVSTLWMGALGWMRSGGWLQQAAAHALYDWSHVLPHQIAGKLLVMWKVWWWPHWSALPFLETVQHDDQDDQSFAQYSLPPNPDLKGPYWDRAVWDPFSAWAKAYSAYFKYHIRQVAGSAACVPALYSLAVRFVFDWFQCAGEFHWSRRDRVVRRKLEEGYTRVRLSPAARVFLGHPSAHLRDPLRASGSRTVPVSLLGLLMVRMPDFADASSSGCSAVFSPASGLLLWADWFGHPLLHLLAGVVVLLLGCWAATRFWRWVSSGVMVPPVCSVAVGCAHFALASVLDPSWDGSFITRMIVWLVDSGASHHMVPDRDLLHNFVPFATKPRIGTAKAGQYSYAIGYGDMHQLLQTSVGERKTVLRGVWCVPGLSSRLFSVRAHLKSAPGNSCVLEFVVSALHTSVFTVPLVDDPSSGLFSFSGTAVVVGSSRLLCPLLWFPLPAPPSPPLLLRWMFGIAAWVTLVMTPCLSSGLMCGILWSLGSSSRTKAKALDVAVTPVFVATSTVILTSILSRILPLLLVSWCMWTARLVFPAAPWCMRLLGATCLWTILVITAQSLATGTSPIFLTVLRNTAAVGMVRMW